MALAAMGDVLNLVEWEQFVDLALDLRPSVERGLLTMAEVRLVALVLLDHAADDRRPRHPEIHLSHLLASASEPTAPPASSRVDWIAPADLLVGPSEIAERLGVTSAGVVRGWRRRQADFPDPIVTLHMGAVWSWPAVALWARSTGRL